MHRLIEDHLEEVLERPSPPAGPLSEHLAACSECREEVNAMRMQGELLRSLAFAEDLAEVQELEPRPGFYARVLERIEAQRPVSIWALFTESLMGRRLVTASLAMALVTGALVVTSESGLAPEPAQAATVDPLYPSGAFAPDLMTAHASNDGAVFMSLVSYHGR